MIIIVAFNIVLELYKVNQLDILDIHFWEDLVERLEPLKLIPRNYPKNVAIHVILGLRSDSSNFSLELDLSVNKTVSIIIN